MHNINLPDVTGVFQPPELGCALFLPGLPGGGGKIHDRSPYGNSATITGAVWQVSPGGLPCLSFDGVDDYANCGNPAALKFGSGEFTIEMWACDRRTSGNSPLLAKGYWQVGQNGNWLLRSHGTNGLEFCVCDGQTPRLDTFNWSGYVAIRNAWHHIAVKRWTNGALGMYVDGILRATASYTGNIGDNDFGLYIGMNPAGSNEYLYGRCGIVRLYRSAAVPSHYQAERYLWGA